MSMNIQSNNLQSDLDTEPWYRQFWPWALISIPAITVIGCMITITLAIRSNDGLVRDDYYKDGLAINKTFARSDKAAAMHLGADVVINPDKRLVEVRFNQDIGEDAVTLNLIHATRSGMDQSIEVSRTGTRIYRGSIESLAPGKWHVDIESRKNGWRLTGVMQGSSYYLQIKPRAAAKL